MAIIVKRRKLFTIALYLLKIRRDKARLKRKFMKDSNEMGNLTTILRYLDLKINNCVYAYNNTPLLRYFLFGVLFIKSYKMLDTLEIY